MKKIRFYVDRAEMLENTVHVTGWALAPGADGPVSVRVCEKGGRPVPAQVKSLSRPDASRAVLGDESRPDCGFDVKFTAEEGRTYRLSFEAGGDRESCVLEPARIAQESDRKYVSLKKALRMTTPAMVGDDVKHFFREGPHAWQTRLVRRHETEENKYLRWREGEREKAH